MNPHGYASTSAGVRSKLELLMSLPDDSEKWTSFTREEMKLPAWMLPAVRAAVRQSAWRGASDPVPQIRSAVRRLAIEMRLNNPDNASERPGTVDEQ